MLSSISRKFLNPLLKIDGNQGQVSKLASLLKNFLPGLDPNLLSVDWLHGRHRTRR